MKKKCERIYQIINIKMKIVDNYIDREIGKQILEESKARDLAHKSSGKLSASRLGDPLQWQVLNVLGVDKEPLDEYIVRKFERGRQIEAWVLKYFKCVDTPPYVEYRGVVGLIDALVDTVGWDFPHGIIPVEIKSVANAKFKRIVREGPDKGHIYQAVLYGLAKDTEWVAICYIASDDYRVQTFMIKVEDYKKEIDDIITRFDNAIKNKTIPLFEPREKWQSNRLYNKYYNWALKSKEELADLSKELFKK